MSAADLVLTGAGRLVTCDPAAGDGPLGVIEHGAVTARAGRITWVGPAAELDVARVGPDATTIDAGGRAVLPGLVDCHTHLIFAGDRSTEFAARTRGERYTAGGVRATVAATRTATDDELRALARARLDRFLAHGVTTVEAKSGYGAGAEEELRILRVAATLDHTVDVVATSLGAHVPAGDPDAHVAEVIGTIGRLGDAAAFVDAWCDPGAFTLEQVRAVLETAKAAGYRLKLHADQLEHGGGAALAAELGATSADHLEHVTEADARALAAAGTVGVLLPGASMMTGGRFAPARMLLDAGVRIALSTDLNPGSSNTENLQLMVALGCAHLGMTPEEAILGVTRNAAAALARDGEIGSLQRGARCDLLVLDTATEIDLAYHYGVNLTERVLVGAQASRDAR